MVSFDLAASQLDQRDSSTVVAGTTSADTHQPIELGTSATVTNGKYQAKSSLDLSSLSSSPPPPTLRSPPRSPRRLPLSPTASAPAVSSFSPPPRSMGSANAGAPTAAFFPTTPPSATAMMDSFSEFHSDAPSADHGSGDYHHQSHFEGGASSSSAAVPYSRQQTYKDRRKNYRREKKKLADELISAIQDPTIVVMSDWLKVRTTLKQWNKYWCELRPGSLYLYKNQKTHKSSNWVGSVMLKMCELIERPSKKNGFCFKLFHPLEHPIWSPKGPHGEAFTSIMFPLPASSIIFRAPSEASGRKWMEAIELSFKYSNMIIPAKYHSPSIQRSMDLSGSVPTTPLSATSSASAAAAAAAAAINGGGAVNNSNSNSSPLVNASMLLSGLGGSIDKSDEDLLGSQRRTLANVNDSEIEKHFDLCDDVHTDHGDQEDSQEHHTTEDSDDDSFFEDEEDGGGGGGHHQHVVRGSTMRVLHGENGAKEVVVDIAETTYSFDGGLEEFGLVGDAGQTEDVPEENKSLLWTLLKQVRPGMDLSKVVLPTFILEPRSFLEKLADYYYHCDIISKAALEEDPLLRMKLILKWYLSGFYKKPKGLKKPYNPILGETFRCCWQHPETDSKTFYIAEQVSHHPPVSAFYVTNRKDGFCISGSILAKSKFYGNSISAILEGTAKLSLLARGEDYLITFPYAHCKGIFLGPLAFELGGKVMITCAKTGYKTELEFKLKPFFGSDDQCNLVVGKLRLGSETLGTIEGHWDSEIWYKDKRGNKGESELFWSGVDPKVKQSRLRRHVVPLEEQSETESERLWSKVTAAINAQNQEAATVEKTALEEAQREAVKQRAARMEIWSPNLFVFDSASSDWAYKLAELRPWDNRTDIKQYEHNYVIRTLTRHLTTAKKTTASSSPSLYNASSPNVTDGAVNGSAEVVAARNKVRYRRQMTCADPTAYKARGEGEEVDGAENSGSGQLVGQRSLKISMSGGGAKSSSSSGDSQSLSSQLSTLKSSLCSLEQKYETMRSEVNHHLHSCRCPSAAAGATLSSSTFSGNHQNVHMSSNSSSTFGITRLRFQSLFSIVPTEVRQVFLVLIAHLLLHTLYTSIFPASSSTYPSGAANLGDTSSSSKPAGQPHQSTGDFVDSSSTSSTS